MQINEALKIVLEIAKNAVASGNASSKEELLAVRTMEMLGIEHPDTEVLFMPMIMDQDDHVNETASYICDIASDSAAEVLHNLNLVSNNIVADKIGSAIDEGLYTGCDIGTSERVLRINITTPLYGAKQFFSELSAEETMEGY